MENKSAFLTTAEAAAALGVTVRRVQVLLNEDRLPGAHKLGRDWIIPRAALAAVKVRKTGRPGWRGKKMGS